MDIASKLFTFTFTFTTAISSYNSATSILSGAISHSVDNKACNQLPAKAAATIHPPHMLHMTSAPIHALLYSLLCNRMFNSLFHHREPVNALVFTGIVVIRHMQR